MGVLFELDKRKAGKEKKIIDLNDLIDNQPAEITQNYWTITVITQVVGDEFIHCDTQIIS